VRRSVRHGATWVWYTGHGRKVAHRSVCAAVRHWVSLVLKGKDESGKAGPLVVYECRFSDDRFSEVRQLERHGDAWRGRSQVHWHVGHDKELEES